MSCIIVSGGHVAIEELKTTLNKLKGKDPKDLCVIAADRGIETLMALSIVPDYIIGDFDSANTDALQYAITLSEEKGVPFQRLNPVKDDTDSEAALQLAFEKSQGCIYFFGGTGSRIDHVLSNLMILKQGLRKDRFILLLDENNRIQACDKNHPVRIQRAEQYGKYVSVIPIAGPVSGVTLKGFYYPVEDAILSGEDSLGTSNEITEDTASISVTDGTLLVIESKD